MIERITIVERDLLHLTDYHEETVERTGVLEKTSQLLADQTRATEASHGIISDRLKQIEEHIKRRMPMSLIGRYGQFIVDKVPKWAVIFLAMWGYFTGKISWAHLMGLLSQ